MKTNKTSDNRISRVLKQAVGLAVIASLAAGILVFTPEKAEAAASQFDMTFGTAGKVVTDFGGFDALNDMATQANGKIVAVGSMEFDFAVARYNSNGTLDTTFDGDGKVTTDLSSSDQGNALAIQVDGKIIVFGICNSGGASFCLARYNVNGSLDTTFDGDGKVITELPNSQRGNDIVLQPDGKIIVAGASFTGPGTDDFTIARYNSDGTLDTTFNTNGYVVTPLSGTDIAYAVALQNDGKLIAVGQSGAADFLLLRYNTGGSLDTSFDTDGIVTTNIAGSDIANDVIIQPDGKIIAAGGTSDDIALARYNANGSLDPTFDTDGKVVADMGGFDYCLAAAIQPNGKIVAVGNVQSGGMAVARFNPNGSLDTSFHGDGKLNTAISGDDLARAVAIQNDGKIVVGGSPSGGTVNFALARFLGDPQKSFTNQNSINPPDRTANSNPPGLPTNYPSIADINGATGTVTKVRVTLTNVTHTFPGDLDVLLVGPQGQQSILMSDAGGGNPGVSGRTYIFDQSAAVNFPDTAAISGFYKPFNGDGPASIEPGGIDVFPAPGPGSQNYGAANLDVFNGTNPNGIWKLYVVDDEAGDVGGMSTFTLEITTTTSSLGNLISDFDGDGRADRAVRRPSNDLWYLLRTMAGYTAMTWGQAGDMLAPADYDGDGKTDIAVFRPATGTWFIVNSGNGAFVTYSWGADGDLPVPADHDGDGRADLVLFRQSNGMFYRRMSDNSFSNVSFGVAGDKPVVGDFDGDGQFDIGVFRPSNNNWYIRKSTIGFFVQTWGEAGDIPVPADYDGDGQTDLAVWRSSNGRWYRAQSTVGFDGVNWGQAGDKPIPADYDGDGKADVAIFRPATGTWYMIGTTIGQLVQQFGQDGDVPTPSAFIY